MKKVLSTMGLLALIVMAAAGFTFPAPASAGVVPAGWSTVGSVELDGGRLVMASPATIGKAVDVPLTDAVAGMQISSTDGCAEEAIVVVLSTTAGSFTGWPQACGRVGREQMTWYEFPAGAGAISRPWVGLVAAYPNANVEGVELGVTRGTATISALRLVDVLDLTPAPAPTRTASPQPTTAPEPTATASPTATVTATATATASPTTSPTTAEPTGSPTASPTTGTPTPSSSASVGLTPVEEGMGNGPGGLPLTGASILTMAGVGGLLVAAGGFILVAMRRRNADQDDTALGLS